MRKIILILIASIFLTGCDLRAFAPAQDKDITTRLQASYEALVKVTACIDLNVCHRNSDYGDVKELYVEAFSNVKTARLLAAKGTTISNERTKRAWELFSEEIEDCQAAIESLSSAHQKFPSLSGAGLTGPTETRCHLALLSAQAFE